MIIKNTFEVTSQFEPPYDTVEGVALERTVGTLEGPERHRRDHGHSDR